MRRVLFVIAGIIALYLVVTKWPKPKPDAYDTGLHTEGLAQRLLSQRGPPWKTHTITYGHVHFREHSHAARTRAAMARSVDSARTTALSFLELQDTFPIEVFLVDSRQEMQQLVGRPIGGMVQSGERSAILVASATYHPFLVHELTHLYSHDHWGSPRNGRWISEGLAALSFGDCQGHSIDDLVKGFHDDGRLVSWSKLVDDFDTLDEISANVQAASVIAFLRERGGMAAVRELWMSEGWGTAERTFAMPAAEIEARWRSKVAAHPSAARLDVAQLRDRGCVTRSG
jgi:hypothetical protein